MKKFAVTLSLAFLFAFSAITNIFAGDLPIGGRTCPPNTTCFVEGDLPIGGKTCPPNTTCVTDGNLPIGGLTSGDKQAEEPTIFKTVIDYLAQLFG